MKGTFKDHLVSWVEEYIKISSASEREAKEILDDIDRRYVSLSRPMPAAKKAPVYITCRLAAVPPFPGLRRFPEGWNFKQWTGNDSKALMKVRTSNNAV